eukprot:3712743-Rhodomonas_salina.1
MDEPCKFQFHKFLVKIRPLACLKLYHRRIHTSKTSRAARAPFRMSGWLRSDSEEISRSRSVSESRSRLVPLHAPAHEYPGTSAGAAAPHGLSLSNRSAHWQAESRYLFSGWYDCHTSDSVPRLGALRRGGSNKPPDCCHQRSGLPVPFPIALQVSGGRVVLLLDSAKIGI